MAELFQTYFEGTADRSNMKDECQREFKDDIKIFGLNKYKGWRCHYLRIHRNLKLNRLTIAFHSPAQVPRSHQTENNPKYILAYYMF